MSVGRTGTGLQLSRIGVAFGARSVLHDVDFDVPAGEWLAVIGPNGAGKTTLLRVLAGLQSHAGAVSIGGRRSDALAARERARLVALVPQDPVIPAGISVLDYVLLGRTPHLGRRLAIGPDDERVAHGVLQRLDLDGAAGRRLAELSGGERQRVIIGRALAQDAAVLLLDEPTSSLDLGHQQEVLELVNDLRVERGLTVVMTMHDLNLAAQFAERLLLLVNGRIVADGDPDLVLDPSVLREHYGAEVAVVDGPEGRVVVPLRR